MKTAIYIGKREAEAEKGLAELWDELRSGGCELCFLEDGEEPHEDTDMLLSVGGDGTFLKAASRVGQKEIPILGINIHTRATDSRESVILTHIE